WYNLAHAQTRSALRAGVVRGDHSLPEPVRTAARAHCRNRQVLRRVADQRIRLLRTARGPWHRISGVAGRLLRTEQRQSGDEGGEQLAGEAWPRVARSGSHDPQLEGDHLSRAGGERFPRVAAHRRIEEVAARLSDTAAPRLRRPG